MDLRRVLYGLHAILRLHFAQEDEAYAWLASDVGVGRRRADRRRSGSPDAEPTRGTRRRPRRGVPRPRRSPPCSSAKRATSARPTPARGAAASPCENASKIAGALRLGDAGAVVLDDDQRAVVRSFDPHPDPGVAGRVLGGVAEQVLHDPLDHRRVGRDHERRGVQLEPPVRHDARRRPTSSRTSAPTSTGTKIGSITPRREPFQIEQVRHDAIEAPRVGGDPARQVPCLVRRAGRGRPARACRASPRIAASGDRRSCETAWRKVFFISSASRSCSLVSRSLARSRSSASARCCSVTSTRTPCQNRGSPASSRIRRAWSCTHTSRPSRAINR